ncbi:fimbrial protein [Janthinobacterium lividum]|uniref:fimbrial protein n=1 Tax=Janthinobacterium lividum TaxID=29581 RepID=UPI00140E5A2F|nr:fimbrial protein [Janthinobacterium lividum]NHQ93878.1 type 1 fimbrial protein [Janthinobacterium lividum]
MNVGSLFKSAVAVAVLWAATDTAFAVTCTYESGRPATESAMPLQVSAISVGRDVPVGTEVYRQTFKIAAGKAAKVDCRNAPFDMSSEYLVETDYGRADWGSGVYAGKVYKTGISGLGVAFNNLGGMLPRKTGKNASACTSGERCLVPFDSASDFELILIKVGDVEPGVLHGYTLPIVTMFAYLGDARMMGFSIRISSSLQIVSRTCTTPDVEVRMGTHSPSKFTAANSATAWTDFSIQLNNCPAFHGTINKSPASWVSVGGTSSKGTGGVGSSDNNKLSYRIDPVRTAISPGTGVLSLDPTAAGRPPAATGIGVQVAIKDGVAVPLASKQGSSLVLRASESSYSIPLRARYLKTGNVVTGGPANASATFTISYE